MFDRAYVSSPSGQRMMEMVTSGFYDQSRIGQSLFQVMGAELDEIEAWTTDLYLELFPQTCTWSVGWWEELYGIARDESLSLELRRQQIMAKVLYRAPINPETIRRGVAALTGCEDVTLEDFVAPYTFSVTVKHQEPLENMTEVWEYIYNIKPSHLSFYLFFCYETPIYHELYPALYQAQVVTKVIPEIVEIVGTDVAEGKGEAE
ncbi:MAG: putative phage tail protein [Eubacteriales bacterium]